MRRRPSLHAFTLIELMLVVAIMGIMSAIAVPAFSMLVNRSKTAETVGNLNSMFKTAAAYYLSERSSQGQVSTTISHCTTDDAGPSPAIPSKDKQPFPGDATFRNIGFSLGDAVYYSYGIASITGASICEHAPADGLLYTFYANGDLDSDGVWSTFELAAGSDGSNSLYHARGFYVNKETE